MLFPGDGGANRVAAVEGEPRRADCERPDLVRSGRQAVRDRHFGPLAMRLRAARLKPRTLNGSTKRNGRHACDDRVTRHASVTSCRHADGLSSARQILLLSECHIRLHEECRHANAGMLRNWAAVPVKSSGLANYFLELPPEGKRVCTVADTAGHVHS